MIFLKKNRFSHVLLFCLFLTLALGLASCGGDDSVRRYTEETPAKESKAPAEYRIKWDIPEGWTEESNTSSMRLATFSSGTGDDAILCTIVPLKGEAGGLQANVIRWLGQLKIQLQSEVELQKFLDSRTTFATKGNFPADLVDFTSLSPKPDDISMMVGIVKISDTTLFIKMSGKKELLAKNRVALEFLCRSIHVEAAS